MKHNYSLLAATMAASILLFSCKKDDNSGNNNGNQTGIAGMKKQIVGSWRVESKNMLITDMNGNVVQTIDELKTCEKDDTYTFTESVYTFDDGANVCPSMGNGNNNPFPWTIYNDSTFDFVYGPGLSTSPRIDFVNATTLQLSARFFGSGDKEVFVYKRK